MKHGIVEGKSVGLTLGKKIEGERKTNTGW